MLGTKEGRKLTKYVHDYVVYDLETTGISSDNDSIVEIGAVRVRDGQVVDEYKTFVNPECHIPAEVSNINGINDDMVKDAPIMADVLPDFMDFIGNDILVGHNIRYFDNRFINRYAKELYGKVMSNDFVDTLLLSRDLFPDMKSHKLGTMIDYYKVEWLTAHRALDDAKMNQQVYECLGKDLEEKGIDTSRIKICPKCGESMHKRNGKYGEFWGCSGYPDCRYTENV